MKIPTFFRFLNKKIEQYNKAAINPFTTPESITIIWINDSNQFEPTGKYAQEKEL